MSFDISALLRRLKPDQRTSGVRRRADADLAFADADQVPEGARLLLDTCVYLDVARGRMPAPVKPLLVRRLLHHSSVCLAELAYGLGALDPADPRSAPSGAVIRDILVRIQEQPRIVIPDDETWVAAGLLAGVLARLQGYGREERRKALADLVFLSAAKAGLIVLTANLAEFDLLQQVVPEGRVVFYRAG